MAQKQYTTYKSDILSFELREALLGVLSPGRYNGFDTFTYDSLSSGNITFHLSHSANSIQILPKGGSSLGVNLGVAITTQGQIIQEDGNISLTIPDNASSSSYRWYIIYMEHDYIEVSGSNPATFGVINGTSGWGVPTLMEQYHRIIIGYLRLSPYGSLVAHCTYFPAQSEKNFGDTKLITKLFGTQYPGLLTEDNIGIINDVVAGVIGNRTYTSNYYLNDGDSITEALDKIDDEIHNSNLSISSLEEVINNKRLDTLEAFDSPSNSTVLDATIYNHGLLPVLPNDSTSFFNGVGAWAKPPLFTFRGNSSENDFNLSTRGGTIITTSTYELDVSSIVPSGFTQVLLKVKLQCLTGTDNPSGRYGAIIFSKGSTSNDKVYIFAPPAYAETALISNPYYVYKYEQIIVNISTARTIRISWQNYSGAIAEWLYDMEITVLGWG